MPDASLADRIRRYALDQHVERARRAQEGTVVIRAGDVHRDLGLTSRVPAVCSALASTLFQRLAGVTPMERSGPIQSTTTQFRYRLEPRAGNVVPRRVGTAVRSRLRTPKPPGPAASLNDSAGAVGSGAAGRRLFLVSCVKTKLQQPAKAQDLYVSDWFRKARAYVEREGGAWRILSAKYGLVDPEEVLPPYEKTLTTMRAAERRAWAAKVLEALEPCLADIDTLVFLAGERYREFLEPSLRSRGVALDVADEGAPPRRSARVAR